MAGEQSAGSFADAVVTGRMLRLDDVPPPYIGLPFDTIIGGTRAATVNATAGNVSVIASSGAMTVFGGANDTVTGQNGSLYIDGTSGDMTVTFGTTGGSDTYAGGTGAGPSTLRGSGGATVLVQGLGKGDIVDFLQQAGNAFINATAGNIPVTLGRGFAAVYGGNGDTITLGFVGQLATDFEGGASIFIGTGGTDSIVGSVARGVNIGATTVTGGAADVVIQGLGKGDVVNFGKQTGTSAINALNGNASITLGPGAATVFAGVGSTVNFGGGNQYAQGLAGGDQLNVGTGGNDTIIGSSFRASGAPVDTITGGAASVLIQGLGTGDVVDFAAQSGSAAINATAGHNKLTLGSGAATVFAGAGDTINLGSGKQYVETLAAPGALIQLGLSGTSTVVGAAAPGAAVTIKGGGGALIYNPGSGNTLLDLAGSTGPAVINGLGPDGSAINDTIIAGNGGTTVFGGSGNRVGVGTNASGTDQFYHSTTLTGASIGFGTNGSSGSTAKVTVTGFAQAGGAPRDFIFYQNETPTTNTSIVTTSTQTTVGGAASTVFTLPDGTSMTLVGVAKANFNSAFFK